MSANPLASTQSPAAPAGTFNQPLSNLIEVVFPASIEAASLMRELGIPPSRHDARAMVYDVDFATHQRCRRDFEQLGAQTY